MTSLFVQVRDEYRTDYDPDILLNIGRNSYILSFLALISFVCCVTAGSLKTDAVSGAQLLFCTC